VAQRTEYEADESATDKNCKKGNHGHCEPRIERLQTYAGCEGIPIAAEDQQPIVTARPISTQARIRAVGTRMG
jgi:hypothetical protein